RYDAIRTRPFSRTRGRSGRPGPDSLVTICAAARLSACSSRRSTLKSSARMGSESEKKLRIGRAVFIVYSERLPIPAAHLLTGTPVLTGRCHKFLWNNWFGALSFINTFTPALHGLGRAPRRR